MDFSKYENDLPYPSKKQLKEEIDNRIKELNDRPLTRAQYELEVQEIEAECKDDHQKLIYEYQIQESKLLDQFWKDAREELGYGHLSKNQIQLIESKAWDEGHANGYSEVFNCLSDIIDFLDEFYSK